MCTYAANHVESVVVKSVDTDVFIICIVLSKEFICQLLFLHRNRSKCTNDRCTTGAKTSW